MFVVTNDMVSSGLQGLAASQDPDQEAHPAVLAAGGAASHPHAGPSGTLLEGPAHLQLPLELE